MSSLPQLLGRAVFLLTLAALGNPGSPGTAQGTTPSHTLAKQKEPRHHAKPNSQKVEAAELAAHERTEQALQKDLEALLRVGNDESNQLAAIHEQLREQDEDKPRTYLDQLEDVLDSSLAGMLAGLALAAATFAVVFTVPLSEKIRTIRFNGGTPKAADLKTHASMQTAVKSLVLSFYFFVGFLIESLTVAEFAKPGGWFAKEALAEWTSDLAGGAGLAVGLFLLIRGAKALRSIVVTDAESD